MSNDKPRLRRGLLDGMADIVTDLWGTPAIPDQSSANAPAPASAPAVPSAPAAPALPPFTQLWKTADEAIDWTEALASPVPTDGLTSPDAWTVYHQHADAVLRGDTAAYLTVLQYANPMADLMPYVQSLDVSTRSADQLLASFTPRRDLLSSRTQEYLAGMALRIARDLFATLPITDVDVAARLGENCLLQVSFQRSEMNKVRFAFVDPVDFVQSSGGVFALENL